MTASYIRFPGERAWLLWLHRQRDQFAGRPDQPDACPIHNFLAERFPNRHIRVRPHEITIDHRALRVPKWALKYSCGSRMNSFGLRKPRQVQNLLASQKDPVRERRIVDERYGFDGWRGRRRVVGHFAWRLSSEDAAGSFPIA